MRDQRLFMVLLLSFVASCGWWKAGRTDGDEPEEEGVELVFPHDFHVDGFGLPCSDCHVGVDQATDLSETHMPTHDTCIMCHDVDNDCETCHPDGLFPYPPEPSDSGIAISHAAHMERVEEGDCTKCHVGANSAPELPLEAPTMETCFGCHQHERDYNEARCQHCHPTLDRVPLSAVAEFEHTGNWISQHGTMARSEGATCQQCHVDSTCSECHSNVAPAAPIRLYPEQVERTVLHSGDWVTTHGIEVRARGETCNRCHGDNDFCGSCHAAWGVSPLSTDPLQRHPSGWLDSGSREFHGVQARYDVVSCAACHDQGAASNCVECHATGRVGGSPHPSGWAEGHELDDAEEEPTCRICHTGR